MRRELGSSIDPFVARVATRCSPRADRQWRMQILNGGERDRSGCAAPIPKLLDLQSVPAGSAWIISLPGQWRATCSPQRCSVLPSLAWIRTERRRRVRRSPAGPGQCRKRGWAMEPRHSGSRLA